MYRGRVVTAVIRQGRSGLAINGCGQTPAGLHDRGPCAGCPFTVLEGGREIEAIVAAAESEDTPHATLFLHVDGLHPSEWCTSRT